MVFPDVAFVDALGYLAAVIVFFTFCMKNMRALRVTAILSNVAFIGYALAGDLTPILVLHGLLLPLNIARLLQMHRRVRQINEATRLPPEEDRFDWLIPLGKPRALDPGEQLFRRGEKASSMFVVTEGEVLLPELEVRLGPGSVLGEMGLFAADGQRTASAEAVRPARVVELSERQIQQLYFDNPAFAYGLVRLMTRRFIQNAQSLSEPGSADPS
jgi:CRP/FNR family cyclic AMP-dependent transcriptional regulator